MKIRSTVVGAIHSFFRDKGFYEFDAPVLQPNQTEGGSTLFEVKYYDKKTYLAQTWQLYAEAAIFSLEKIYNMGPTFRAEKSKTSRHLSEFWMAEMEVAWMELDEVIKFAKEEISATVQDCIELANDEETAIKVTNPSETEILEFVFISGKPHKRKFCKLLGHGGALVADTKTEVIEAMNKYETEGEDFGKV